MHSIERLYILYPISASQGWIQEFIMGGPGWVRGDHQSGGWPRAN